MTGSQEVDGSIPFSSTIRRAKRLPHFWGSLFTCSWQATKVFPSGPFKNHERVVCPEQVRPDIGAERVEGHETILTHIKNPFFVKQVFFICSWQAEGDRRTPRAAESSPEQGASGLGTASRGTRKPFYLLMAGSCSSRCQILDPKVRPFIHCARQYMGKWLQ